MDRETNPRSEYAPPSARVSGLETEAGEPLQRQPHTCVRTIRGRPETHRDGFRSESSSRSPSALERPRRKERRRARSVSFASTLGRKRPIVFSTKTTSPSPESGRTRQSSGQPFYLALLLRRSTRKPIPKDTNEISLHGPVAKSLRSNEAKIVSELNDVQVLAMGSRRLYFPDGPSGYPGRCVPAPR